MLDKIISLISEVLGVDTSVLNPESGFGNTSGWDSLAQLNIVSAVEDEFDLTLDLDDILSMNTIQDIVNLLNEKDLLSLSSKSSDSNLGDDSTNKFKGLIASDEVITGPGSFSRLIEFVEDKVLVILGSKRYSAKWSTIIENLFLNSKSEIALIHKEFGEPNETNIINLVRDLNFHPDTIVGIGGGSVIDTCKLVYTKLLYPESDLSEWSEPFSLPIPKSNISLISIPTTHGSGSEVSSAAVFNTKSTQKKVILSHNFISKVVIHDSNLLLDLPQKIAIDTTLDAFTHSIEGYLSKLENPHIEPLVLESLSNIIEILDDGMVFGAEDRETLLRSSYLAGIVQNHCSTGLCHSIAHQLSRFGIPHGRLNAVFLPSVLQYNYSRSKEKMDAISQKLNFESGKQLISWLIGIQSKYDVQDLDAFLNFEQNVDFGLLVKDIKNDMTYSTTPSEIDDTELEKIITQYITK